MRIADARPVTRPLSELGGTASRRRGSWRAITAARPTPWSLRLLRDTRHVAGYARVGAPGGAPRGGRPADLRCASARISPRTTTRATSSTRPAILVEVDSGLDGVDAAARSCRCSWRPTTRDVVGALEAIGWPTGGLPFSAAALEHVEELTRSAIGRHGARPRRQGPDGARGPAAAPALGRTTRPEGDARGDGRGVVRAAGHEPTSSQAGGPTPPLLNSGSSRPSRRSRRRRPRRAERAPARRATRRSPAAPRRRAPARARAAPQALDVELPRAPVVPIADTACGTPSRGARPRS